MKIQINLYEHREIDKIIMNNLGLDKSTNPNSLVKDLLYKLALNMNQEETQHIAHKEIIVSNKPVEKPKVENKNKSKLINSAKSLNIF